MLLLINDINERFNKKSMKKHLKQSISKENLINLTQKEIIIKFKYWKWELNKKKIKKNQFLNSKNL